jgi:NADPH-dependent curcumin reductase CurA
MSTYTSIHLATRPAPSLITASLFKVERNNVPRAGSGQVLVKQTHMFLDPAMIGWMSADPESYIPPVAIGEVMRSFGVGEVIESNHPDYVVGDRVRGMFGWTRIFSWRWRRII